MKKTAMTEAARAQALEQYISSTKGEVMLLSEAGMDVEVIETGILSLDAALGAGGVPRGRIVEIFGPEHSGKTSVCLAIAGAVQKAGGFVGIIDAEHALDPEWARTFGVSKDRTAINQPMSGEAGLQTLIEMAQSRAFDLLIVDSVAALTPQAEIDGDMGDQQVGAQARMMSKALRKVTAIASETNTTIIFINQLREKIGVMYGSPETTTGGKALKFYASVRLDVRSAAGARLKNGDKAYGQRITVKVVKNKVAAPFTKCEFDLLYGQGIDKSGCVLEAAEEAGALLRPKGSSKYTLASTGEVLPATGKENVRALIASDPDLAAQLTAAVYAALAERRGVEAEDDGSNDDDGIAALEATG